MVVKRISIRFTRMSSPSGNAFNVSKISLTRSFSVESVSVFTFIFFAFLFCRSQSINKTQRYHFFHKITTKLHGILFKIHSIWARHRRRLTKIFNKSKTTFFCQKFEMQNNGMRALCMQARKCQHTMKKTTNNSCTMTTQLSFPVP